MAIGKHLVEHAILGVDDTATLDTRYLKLDATNYTSVIFPDGQYLGIDQIRARDAGGLLLTDDGNNGIFVKDGGNVGIGTTNPANALSVYTTTNADGISMDGTTNPALIFKNAGTIKGYFGITTADGAWHSSTKTNDFIFRTQGGNLRFITQSGGSLAMTILNGGNVGIGTMGPSSALHVEKSVTGEWAIKGYNTVASGGYGVIGRLIDESTTYSLAAYSGSSYKFVVQGNGNVGIGVTDPDSKTEINTGVATTIGLTVKGFASQSANLQEWRNVSDTVLAGVDERGVLFSNGGSDSTNLFVGEDAGKTTLSGVSNTAIGVRSGFNLTTGGYNVMVGEDAGYNITSGAGNVCLGRDAGYGITTGTDNFALGTSSGNVAAGAGNVAIGTSALAILGTKSNSVALGRSSLYSSTTGSGNIGIGAYTGYYNQTGTNNVFIGTTSGQGATTYNVSNNVFIGSNTGYTGLITGANNNVFVGFSAGKIVTSGANNIYLGCYAGDKQTTLSDLLIIDNQTRADAATELTNSILYGVMAATPASQTLRVNAAVEVFGSTGLKISFDATDNTTLITDTNGDLTITTSGSNLKIPQATQIGDGGTTNYANFAADGELTLEGTARVYKNQWINVQGLKAPGAKPAVLVDWGISCAWEFTDGTDDTICSSIRLPQDMDRTVAPEFKIGFASATNTGDVVWQLEYIYLTPNEDTTAAAQETLTTTTTISGTSNGLTIATITGMDLPSDTDQLMKLRIKRLGADGDDDLGDDCVLVGAGLKYISDKLGVAT